jgi:death-on-curing family protein
MARELMSYGEPIPDYSTRDNNLLESSLGAPKQMFDGKFLYPSLAEQAAILFFSLIKNHPFKNGNKRVAVMALLVFLSFNGKWLDVPPTVLYEIAFDVSNSEMADRANVFQALVKFITKYIINFSRT